MRALAIIPARYASSRFPGKPLADIAGKPMIQRVFERAQAAGCFDQVVVATDDQRIFDCVKSFGGSAQMTSADHRSGTDRCAEVVQLPAFSEFEIVVNVQGDEPFVEASQLRAVVACLSEERVKIATIATPIESRDQLMDPNTPKVVLSKSNDALYFSRSPLPYAREGQDGWDAQVGYLKHIGLYGFRRATLIEVSKMAPTALEIAESLEQLRWLENGLPIRVAISDLPTYTIDTPADLANLLGRLKQGELPS